MSTNMPKKSKLWRDDAGIALLTTLMLLFLMSSLLVGFTILLVSNQQLAGANNDDVTAFYGAEAGMEKLTSDLGNLFTQTYAPTMTQINALETAPPAIPNITYTNGSGTPAYLIQPAPGVTLDANGNPQPAIASIKAGPYSGMTAMITGYTLTVTARTNNSREVKLQRTSETVGIPMFQFAMFCEVDCAFHAGQNFTIAGRVHGNKNLFIAAGGGTTLQMQGKVDAYGDIIREYMDNGASVSSNWNGTVSITTNSGGTTYRTLGLTEGSITGGEGCSGCANTNWPTISRGSSPADYASNLINGQGSLYPQYSTGADFLNLGIVTMGGGTTQPIDLIRRPIVGESNNVTGERYFAQASLVILLSDNPTDITSLPCVDSTPPVDLSQLAQPVAQWPTTGNPATLKTKMTTAGTTVLPLAASGAATNTTSASSYASADGYWLPYGYPIIKGFLKIQAQTAYGSPCGTWKDVTLEILSLGYVGGNLNPQTGLTAVQYAAPSTSGGAPLLALPTSGQVATAPCASPHPNAVIRLERVRDNPSTWASTNTCGLVSSTSLPSDFWPNTLFDTREGTLRDTTPATAYQSLPTLNGTMHYVELDIGNLAKWFAGTIGSSGPSTKDTQVAPNDFAVYFSDRRGNYTTSQTWTGTWPPTSPSGHETGEYGWYDFVNSGDATNGCPNGNLDSGEDLDSLNQLMNYNAASASISYIMAAGTAASSLYNLTGTLNAGGTINNTLTTAYGQYGFYNGLTTAAIKANPNCSTPSYASTAGVWPMMYTAFNNAARENPPIFFRRALKVTDAKLLTGLGTCPGGGNCGLAIAAENPVYIQGDYNANSASHGFTDPNVGASIAADAVTILSNSWNDVNSFTYNQYNIGGQPRTPTVTYYRTAVIGGKGLSFPEFGGNADNGTDGGVHNFLRYLEDWGNNGGTPLTVYYMGALVNLSTNRQANGIFKCCNTVYSVPNRQYSFDSSFLNPSSLPPRTPLFHDVDTTGWTRLQLADQ